MIKLKKIPFTMMIVSSAVLTGCGGGSSSVTPSGDYYDVISPIDGGSSYVPPPTNQEKIGADYWHEQGFTGAGETVALLDSGTYQGTNRSEGVENYDTSVVDNLRAEYTYSQDWSNAADTGYNDIDDSRTVTGEHGHEMAEVIGSNVSGRGIAPDVSIMHGVISDGGYTDAASMWNGLKWANDAGAIATNLSFQFGNLVIANRTEDISAVESNPYAYKHDITNRHIHDEIVASGMAIVHSTSNSQDDISNSVDDNQYFSSIVYSNIKDNLLLVGALNDDMDTKTDYSGVPGAKPEVQARWIMSPGNADVDSSTGVASIVSGTSPAAAYITGAIATMHSRWTTLTGADIANILLQTANKNITNYDPAVHGQGAVDLVAAWNPVGSTSIKTSQSTYVPVQAASIVLPKGFKEQSFKTSIVDSKDRDFEVTISTVGSKDSSDFSTKFALAQKSVNDSVIAKGNGYLVKAGEGYTGYDAKIANMDGFTKDMFSQSRSLQSLKIESGDTQISMGANISDQMNSSVNGQGLIAKVKHNGLEAAVFKAKENGTSFYGADNRESTGAKLAYNASGLMLGVEVVQNQTNGSSLVNSMKESSKAVTLGVDLLSNKDFTLGVIGKVSQKDLAVNMTLPKSIGDGNLAYQDESLKDSVGNVGKGIYAKAGNFNVSAYQDSVDSNIMATYQSNF